MLGCGRGKEKPVFVSESKASPIGVSPSLAAHSRRAAGPQGGRVCTGPLPFLPGSNNLQGGTGKTFITLEILYLDRGP